MPIAQAHLIRMAVGFGFRRARLRYAHLLLRGKNLQTGEITQETREENLAKFRHALDVVTNINQWHSFLNIFFSAGYVKSDLVNSQNAVVFSYVLYLLGRFEYKVPVMDLKHIIRKWIFMVTVTSFYTTSAETLVEKQLADLRDVKTSDQFVAYLDRVIANRFTEDYFTYVLPDNLSNSAPNSPAWFGYIASLIVLGVPILFDTAPLAQYFSVGANGNNKAFEKHHIFPKQYLDEIGYTEDREKNQIANFALIDSSLNKYISDDPPAVYVSRLREKLGEEGYKLACAQNALPDNFEHMSYPEFLHQRRLLMAQIVKKAYMKLDQ